MPARTPHSVGADVGRPPLSRRLFLTRLGLACAAVGALAVPSSQAAQDPPAPSTPEVPPDGDAAGAQGEGRRGRGGRRGGGGGRGDGGRRGRGGSRGRGQGGGRGRRGEGGREGRGRRGSDEEI